MMAVGTLILVETSSPGNLGAALRVAANFGVSEIKLVRPLVSPNDPEALRWACGAHAHLEISVFGSFSEAVAPHRTLVATASGRGRQNQPLLSPHDATAALAHRGLRDAALVFGSETRGLSRAHLDRCHLAVRLPTNADFPVLNLTQAIAILLGHLTISSRDGLDAWPEPAPHETIDAMMDHLHRALLLVEFLDPVNPDRILRKLRQVFGRAGLTENEAAIFRGICRQVEWAVGKAAHDQPSVESAGDEDQ